jgi:alkylated DNA repair protein (DNA oxidative demethylase)
MEVPQEKAGPTIVPASAWNVQSAGSIESYAMDDFILRKGYLSSRQQARLVEIIHSIEPGFYVPKTRWGKSMNLRMNCIGAHWSARDYKYHPTRVDIDQLPCAPIPDELQKLAQRALIETEYLKPSELRPYETCIVNWYEEKSGKLGDHADNSESKESLASGYPVVSLSVGASCIFRIGGLERRGTYKEHVLDSGDLVIFGRSRRLAFHGVKKILPDTTPPGLGFDEPGRINLTFRLL